MEIPPHVKKKMEDVRRKSRAAVKLHMETEWVFGADLGQGQENAKRTWWLMYGQISPWNHAANEMVVMAHATQLSWRRIAPDLYGITDRIWPTWN